MNISSLPSANLFLTSDQQTATRHARVNQQPLSSEGTTMISTAGQLRGALDRLGAAAIGLHNTDVFSPKALSNQSGTTSPQEQAQEREKQRQLTPEPPPPPVAANTLQAPPAKPVATQQDDKPDIAVSLQQSISDGAKASLRQRDARRLNDRAAGELDPATDQRAPAANSSSGTAPKTRRLQDVAFGKPADGAAPVVAPLSAPLPSAPAVGAARELAGAVNELRATIARTDNASQTDARTQSLRDQATRALGAVDRQADQLSAIGIQSDQQGALQVNQPVLQRALETAPKQVQQVLDQTGRDLVLQLAPSGAGTPQAADSVPAAPAPQAPAPTRVELTRELPSDPATLANQAFQLGQALDSIAASGIQLQRELVRQDAQSPAQSSLLKHLDTIAHAMSP